MKFKVQRKLNLANIDKDLWPYETEDLGIEDADSFEEAHKMVDAHVQERIGYYKAKSEEYRRSKPLAPHEIPINPSPAGPIGSPAPSPDGMPSKFDV